MFKFDPNNHVDHFDVWHLILAMLFTHWLPEIIPIFRFGTQQMFENVEIFKVKLRWSKSSQLLQRVVFLVINYDKKQIKEPTDKTIVKHQFCPNPG